MILGGYPDVDKFLPALAVELEDLGLRIGQVRVGYLRRRGGDAERFMALLDYLNVDSMVARPGINDVNTLAELLDEASMYGVRVIWEFGVGGDFLRSLVRLPSLPVRFRRIGSAWRFMWLGRGGA